MGLPKGLDKKLSRTEFLLLIGGFFGILLLVLAFQTKKLDFFRVKKPLSSKPGASTVKREDLKGKFFLVPEEGVFAVGQVFTVGVWLDTGGLEVDAADVELLYNPEYLLILNLKKGDILDEYPEMSFDDNQGKIIMRGIVWPDNVFAGNGKIGEITFKTIKKGGTFLDFDFEPFETTDSNLVQTGKAEDILGIAKGAKFVIN